MSHRHYHSVFIRCEESICRTCGDKSQYAVYSPSGNISNIRCARHASPKLVEQHRRWMKMQKEGCIFCDNPTYKPEIPEIEVLY